MKCIFHCCFDYVLELLLIIFLRYLIICLYVCCLINILTLGSINYFNMYMYIYIYIYKPSFIFYLVLSSIQYFTHYVIYLIVH